MMQDSGKTITRLSFYQEGEKIWQYLFDKPAAAGDTAAQALLLWVTEEEISLEVGLEVINLIRNERVGEAILRYNKALDHLETYLVLDFVPLFTSHGTPNEHMIQHVEDDLRKVHDENHDHGDAL